MESHVSRRERKREKKTKQDSKNRRLRENFCLYHVLGVLVFLLPFRSLMALQKLCRVTRAISKVMVKLRRYHSLIDRKKRRKESEDTVYLWC